MEKNKSLQAGFCREDITPDFTVGLAGYGGEASRQSTDVVEPLTLTCIAIKEGEQTVLIYTIDAICCRREHQEIFRERLTEETGVPSSHIFFGATHCHNGPSMVYGEAGKKYAALMQEAAVRAAKGAIADLSPAVLFAAKPKIEGMNFTRHYYLEDGTPASSNTYIPKGAKLIGHATTCDPCGVLVKFEREGKKDIVMINWQAHPDDASEIGFTSICPGFVGRIRENFETETGTLCAYFNGTSGNLIRFSRIPELNPGLTYREYGEKMGGIFASFLDSVKPAPGGEIRVVREAHTGRVNHTQDHLVDKAKEVIAYANNPDRPTTIREFSMQYGIASRAHARGIVMRSGQGETIDLELNAFTIGGLGFVTNTCETFGDQGVFIKENSPFDITFIITANRSYLPCEAAYAYDAYEAVGGSCYFEKGTAEAVADHMVQLLEKVK